MTTMDEHEQRAREVVRDLVRYLASPCPSGEPDFAPIIASALRAAVAAERERWKGAADAIVQAWDHDEIGQVDGALIDALRSIPTPAPAQAEQRGREEDESVHRLTRERDCARAVTAHYLEQVRVAEAGRTDALANYAAMWALLDELLHEQRSITADEAAWFYTGQSQVVWDALRAAGLAPERAR